MCDSIKSGLDSETLKEMYKKMCLIRQFEENMNNLYQRDLAYGGMHLSAGEEAIAVGACFNLTREDKIVTSHRGHGHCIAKGADIKKMMAELLARKTGLCKGNGGSMHITDMSIGILGAQGIVGGGICIAVGSGLTSMLQKKDNVTVCFFGDGAANTGSFHEGLNMASVMKLPIIYICENNQYGMSVPFKKSCNIENIASRAVGYGIPGEITDGNNVIEVYDAVKRAYERAKNNEGPTLIECKTYRWYGHMVGDPGIYRPKEEVKEWKAKDPIVWFEKYLIENRTITHEDADETKQNCRKIIEEANEYALNSPEPTFEDMFKDIYYEASEAGV
ncbi:MAG: thiamine pyrophosphate-dependent dehydrogenase E1 component subunit alpha [Clostridiales bacterium]|nr:thiamine pyrophosphate-dependent dehydrogenase E1 component subunit alpha [Clostridiales bacterium]